MAIKILKLFFILLVYLLKLGEKVYNDGLLGPVLGSGENRRNGEKQLLQN